MRHCKFKIASEHYLLFPTECNQIVPNTQRPRLAALNSRSTEKRRLLGVGSSACLGAWVAYIIAAAFAEVALCAEGWKVLKYRLAPTYKWDDMVSMQFDCKVGDWGTSAVDAAKTISLIHLQPEPSWNIS